MAQEKHITKTAGLISIFTMTSRVFGYVRDGLGGAILGAGLANDAYLAAFRIPNLLRDLFAEGALSSAFVPTFTGTMVNEGREKAWRLVSIVVNVIILIMAGLVILGEMGAPYIVKGIVPGFSEPGKIQLTIHLTRILFPFLAFISLAAVLMGILNSNDRFGIPAFAPVMLNIAMIITGIFICPLFGNTPEKQVVGWAWGALAGGFVQMAFQLPGVLKLGYRWNPLLIWNDLGLKKIVKLMIPAVAGLSVTQINLFINTIIASYLPEGSVTYLYYGNRLMQLPLGVLGVSIATALLPVTSKYIAKGENDKFVEAISYGLRLLFFITLPCAVGIIVLSEPINRLLFEYGRFTPEAVRAVAQASIFYTLGLVTYSGVKVVAQTFYALNESRVPVIAAVISVAVNITLNLLLMNVMGFRGLALSTAVASVVNFTFLMYRLRKRMGYIDGKRILNSLVRVFIASLFMGMLIWHTSKSMLPGYGFGMNRVLLASKVLLMLVIAVISYLLFAFLFGVPEQRSLVDFVRNKIIKGQKAGGAGQKK